MEYEVDFLAVGNESKSGDAIAVRAIDDNQQVVMIIDGGTAEAGENLVEHIKKYYKTNTIDLMISTHPDADHTSGLKAVLENMAVSQLWMHKPWEHSRDIESLFLDGRITNKGIEEKFRKSLESAHDLEKLATRRGVKILEPFSDNSSQSDVAIILGPSRDYYESLLPSFRCFGLKEEQAGLGTLLGNVMTKVEEKVSTALESIGLETLVDPKEDATSAENNSSVITLINFGGDYLFFTGDAGVPALMRAADKADEMGIDLTRAKFIQIPHHGSKRNVGPTLLNRIVGPKLQSFQKEKRAYVSSAKKGAPKHPAKKVTNAFKRRGAEVYGTTGNTLHHFTNNVPVRGWTSAVPIPFYEVVDE